MIILGSKGRPKPIARGNFFCPACNQMRNYQRYRVDKYFTLYWIPIFRIGNMGEYIQCEVCKNSYPPDAVNYHPPTEEEKLHVAVLTELRAGIPAHMLIRKLENQYGDHHLATQYVYNLLGNRPMQCPKCHYLYHEIIARCLNCGELLNPSTSLLPL